MEATMNRFATRTTKRTSTWIALIALVATGLGVTLLVRGGSEAPASQPTRDSRDAGGARPSSATLRPGRVTGEPDPSASGNAIPFSASPGERFVYELQARWQSELRQQAPEEAGASGIEWKLAKGMPRRVDMSLGARLHVVVVDRRDDAYILRFSLESPTGS